MEIKVRLTGLVRDIVKEADFHVSLPEEATVEDLLQYLIVRYGERLRGRILRRGKELERSVRIFIDNEAIDSLKQRLKTEARAAQEVTVIVLSPVAGG